jgi:drug/metabolite transporter (DMT)-like permease
MKTSTKDFLKLHWIVFLWGFTALIGKELSIASTDVVLYRTALAALALGLYLFYKGHNLRFSPKVLGQFGLTGLVIAGHWFLFFESARVSSVSVCLAGMATTTFWTSLLEPLARKRPINRVEVLLGLVVMGGLYLIFRFEFDSLLGLSLALASAMLAAVFSVANASLVAKHNEYAITFYEMLAAALVSLLFIPFYKSVGLQMPAVYAVPNLRDWLLLLVLALLCTVYAFSVSVELMKRISAFAVNLAVNMEPVYGIILAVLIYGESEVMSAGFYWGTLIIMAAVFAKPIFRFYAKKRLSRRSTIG